jgi:tetratricopeptide (TPR) repeat protein
MTIQVPFRLRRRSSAEPATALFIPARDPGSLFAQCARLGLDPTARVFDLAGGFLLALESPATARMPGALRLRALAPAVYVPVDAELIPALLEDEANGMARDWGVVFLPGGRAILFDRHAPVELTELLQAPVRQRRDWRSFPEPRPLADRLVQIALELPEQPPEALYRDLKRQVQGPGAQAGPAERNDGLRSEFDGAARRARTRRAGTEAQPAAHATPAAAGPALHIVGEMVEAVGAAFTQAGQALAALKEKAQWDWVDHSALLRKLVREFREGDPERALRRAIPIAPRGETTLPAPAGGLPWNRPIYSLAELLRRPRRGETTPVLHAQPGVMQLLAQEYQRAAERAVEQGDFRRAAYIYGVLLRDDRQAASVLQRGGLHHDAAILYLKKLNDAPAAAAAFEAAGAVDRAIAIYRHLGRHEAAGDLLRRIGEEHAAVAEYGVAAALLAAAASPDHLAAGRLFLEKARRTDLAIDQFQAGWARRPRGNAVLCALELARFYAQQGAIEPIWTLLDEADELFAAPGQPYDGFFCTEITRLALLPSMAAAADDLRDRTLQSLVRKLRGGIVGCQSAPALVSALLGRSKLWPTALVRDAEFAATAELKRSRVRASDAIRDPRIAGTQIGRGVITAVCQAKATRELFVGFENGMVLAYRPQHNLIVKVADDLGPVTSLAVDADGITVVVLYRSDLRAVMGAFRRNSDGSFRPSPEVQFSAMAESWLTPVLHWGVERLVGLADGPDLLIVDAASGVLWQRRRIAVDASNPAAALLLPAGSPSRPPERWLVVLTHDGQQWIVLDERGSLLHDAFYQWLPGVPASSTLRSVPIGERFVPPSLELLGVDSNGTVSRAHFHFEDGSIELVSVQVATTPGGYLAATRSGPSTIIAVSSSRVDWLDGGGDRLHVVSKRYVDLPHAIACFSSHTSTETLVICSDGFVARLAAPRNCGESRAPARSR